MQPGLYTPPRPHRRPVQTLLHQTQPHLASHIVLLCPALPRPGLPYHDGIAGPRGQKYVVRVCRDASVSPLNVLRHILPDRLDSRANAIGT